MTEEKQLHLGRWLGSLVKVRGAAAGALGFSFQDDIHIICGVVEEASLIQELTLVLNLHPAGQYVGVSGVIYGKQVDAFLTVNLSFMNVYILKLYF